MINDFTKEELLEIRIVYKEYLKGYNFGHDQSLTELESSVINKLQSMLDNYCEHNGDNKHE